MQKTELDKLFEAKYKSLNKEQKKAVDTIDGPVMVIAGPGTGKTTILTLRIANILKETDTPPSGILALTFTDAGVKAMRNKLREIIGARADEVRIHTFHGFAGSVISEFPEHFPLLSRSKQITPIEAERILREILKEKKYSKLRPLGDTDFYLHSILGAISDSKNEAWSPEVVKQFAKEEIERVKNNPDSISTRGASKGELKADSLKRIERCEKTLLFADIFEEYEKKKTEEKLMDFDDLLFGLLGVLQTDKLLLQLLQEKFLYILVDEHQDTNDSQNLIVTLLSSFFDNPNIFVVGDEKQAIYRFQGASVENFLKFQNIWKDMKLISLSDNYRSHQNILDATFSMIEENYEEGEHQNLRVKLKSGSKEKEKPVDLIFAPDSDSADEYLIEELKNVTSAEPEAKIAVILRRNKDVDHILSLCETHGVPASAERGADIFSHPLGTEYFKILEYIYDPSKTECLAETIASGLWNLDFSVSSELVKKIRSGDLSDIEKHIPALTVLKKEKAVSGVISYLILVGELSGLTSREKLLLPMSVEVWRSIIDLARDLAVSTRTENATELIKQLLDYKKTAERKQIKISSGKSDSNIQIMTAHSSKGLEYDYVFLPYSLEEYWMKRPKTPTFVLPREKDLSDEIKDSRRLFYVALTRAKKHIVVIVPHSDGLGKEFTPLRFIDELHKPSVVRVSKEEKISMPKTLNGSKLLNHRQNELLEYTKSTLLEKGLSVTALNHFLECPSKFLYKSILKIPEAPNSNSEKGIAMHKAVSDVWKSDDKSVPGITSTIKNSINSYFSISLLPKNDKEIVLEELVASASKVAQSLAEHFSLKGEVFTDKWLDTIYKTQYNSDEILLTLHGQMDAMVSSDDDVLVFDYKTKEGMSLNAIKGETKSDDGNYFRQLIYYKILLEGNSLFKTKNILPALVFIKPDSKGRCPIVSLPISPEDTNRVKSEIDTLLESVYSGKFLNDNCDDPKCQYCLFKKYRAN